MMEICRARRVRLNDSKKVMASRRRAFLAAAFMADAGFPCIVGAPAPADQR